MSEMSKVLKFKIFKRFVPKTLFGRSLLILITPIILIQAISTFLFFDSHWSKMTSRLAYSVAGEITWISNEVEIDSSPENITKLTDMASRYLSMLIAYYPDDTVSTEDKRRSWVGWESLIGETLDYELSQLLNYPYTIDVDFQEKWVEIRVQLKQGVLSVSLPQRRLYSSSSYIFLLWVFSISIILLIIAVLFMRNQVRPIRRLAIAAERFGKGRDVSDFKIEGAKEVRQAGQAFVEMRTRIQRQISQRTEMLAGVSHDLRTPLTRLKLQLAMLGDTPDTEAMRGDIHDMEYMIDGYLNFVRGDGRESSQIINLVELLGGVIADAKRQGIKIEYTHEMDKLFLPLRQSAFKRCITNIVSNADKYAQEIWVSLKRAEEGRIEIIIEDNGQGIPEAQYEDVFRPFYRVDSSRNSETGGVGLGLPIAMDIVHSHGGKIWLGKSIHGGLSVFIKLPI